MGSGKERRAEEKRARRAEASAAPLPLWRQPVFRFLGLFVLLAGAFELAWLFGLSDSALLQHHLETSTLVTSGLLNLFGVEVTASGTLLSGPAGAITVALGCDGCQPIALFACAVIAFPVSMRARLIGLAIGLPLLFTLNVVRIATLYVIVSHHQAYFEDAHLVVWPMAFILCSLLLWILWVRRALPRPASS